MTGSDELRKRIAELESELAAALQRTGATTPADRLSRAIFDGSADAMFIADDSGRYVDANRAACTVLGRAQIQLGARLSVIPKA